MASNPVEHPESVASADSTTSLLVQFSKARDQFEAELHAKLWAGTKKGEERMRERSSVFVMYRTVLGSDLMHVSPSAQEEAEKSQDMHKRAELVLRECARFREHWQGQLKACSSNDKKEVQEGLEKLLYMAKGFIKLEKELSLLLKDIKLHYKEQNIRLLHQYHDHRERQLNQQLSELHELSLQPGATVYADVLKPLHKKQYSLLKCPLYIPGSMFKIGDSLGDFRALQQMREQLQQRAGLKEEIDRLMAQEIASVDTILAREEKKFRKKLRRDHEEALSISNHWRCAG